MKNLLASLLVLLLVSPVAAGWRETSAYVKANSGMLVFVITKDDGTIIRESAYCGSTTIAADRVLTASHCVDSATRVKDTWVVYEDGRRYKVARVVRMSAGWDLAELDVPGVRFVGRKVEVTEDVATGDEVIGVGAPGGERFKSSWGRVDRIYMGLHDVCDGVRRPVPIGHKEHQIIEVDRVTFFGYSGGGVFNEDGKLVGVHVRGFYWEPYPGYSCSESYKGELVLFGAMVGPVTINRFLRGESP